MGTALEGDTVDPNEKQTKGFYYNTIDKIEIC